MTLPTLSVVAPVELGARHVGIHVVSVLGVGWGSGPFPALCCEDVLRAPATMRVFRHGPFACGAALSSGVVAHYCRMSHQMKGKHETLRGKA